MSTLPSAFRGTTGDTLLIDTIDYLGPQEQIVGGLSAYRGT
jgi:hypothetical protein